MNSLKPHLAKVSPLVVSHIEQLLQDFPILESGDHILTPQPKLDLTTREYDLFWRYHGHFKQEFVHALCNVLPQNTHMIEYDHLNNRLTVEVTA